MTRGPLGPSKAEIIRKHLKKYTDGILCINEERDQEITVELLKELLRDAVKDIELLLADRDRDLALKKVAREFFKDKNLLESF